MRFPELRWSPPRKVISEGVAVSAPFELRNISEKNSLFLKREDEKKDWGGGGRCVDTFDLFFLRGKSKLPHPWDCGGGGGGGGGGWWPSNGMALEINFAKEGIGCPFWTESL